MHRALLTVAVALLAGARAAAQDDYDLANALSDRGWYDLAEELYRKIQASAGLGADQRAEGAYGLARLNSVMAQNEADPKKKVAMYDQAIGSIRDFINKFPAHKRRNEAYADIGDLYQQKGKFLMSQARTEPDAPAKAESAFADAEKLFQELIANLKGKEPPRPDEEKRKNDKQAYEREMTAFEDWEQKMMFAKFNFGVALFNHAETYADNPEKQADLKRLLEQMVKFFETDFMWSYENYIKAYEAFVYMGRAFELLATKGEPAKAEDYWKQCFTYIGKGMTLPTSVDAQMRQHEGIRGTAMYSCYHEMKAHVSYGDTKKGGAATREYAKAAKLAEDLFKWYPNARNDEFGRAIRIEQARAYGKSGQTDKAVKLLNEIKKEAKDTPFENLAIDLLGELVGEANVQMAIDAADNYVERGPAFLYGAVSKYRRALAAIRKKDDEKHIPHCWVQIAKCYYFLDRYWEAVSACSMLEKGAFKGPGYGAEAALLKLQCLSRLKKLTGRKEDEEAYGAFLRWATENYPKEVGSSAIRAAAIDLDNAAEKALEAKKYTGEFVKAADQWGRIGSDSPFYGESLFSIGYNLYRHARLAKPTEEEYRKALDRALDAFRRYLDWYGRLQEATQKERDPVKYALGAIYFAVRIYNDDKVNKPEDALKVSADLDKRFSGGDPIRVMRILALRIDSKAALGRIEEAEEDLKALQARYKSSGFGRDAYADALGQMAQLYEQRAAQVQKTDAEKSEILSIKSGNYYYELYKEAPERFQGAQADQVAGMFFQIAEQKMEVARRNSDRQQESEARGFYEKSQELYKEFMNRPGVTDEMKASIQERITRCFLQTGKFEEAEKIYVEVTGKDPNRTKGHAWLALADCYMARARNTPPSGDRNQLIEKADEIYAHFAAVLMQGQRGKHFWECLYKHAEAMYEYNLEGLLMFYKNMQVRGYSPAWDENKWGFQTRLEELRSKLKEKVPSENK